MTAAIANVSSTAGNLYTCPPASIQLQIPSTIPSTDNGTVGTVTPGTNVPLTTTIIDTQGNPITGLALGYSSTNPLEISVGSWRSGVHDLSIDRGDYRRLQPAELQPLADHSDRPTWHWTSDRQ